jgi:3-isopropylmalate/(R)-2-methylmalate dehydratase small subunit
VDAVKFAPVMSAPASQVDATPTAANRGGRAWVFGDNVDTDVLAPGLYMKGPIDALAKHCLEALDPRFAGAVRPGDIVVAGSNFGMGSSREQAAMALKALGVAAVVAKSFARIFYRNAMNLALPALACPEAGTIAAGDRLFVRFGDGVIENLTQRRHLACEPIPPHLLAMIADGGLLPHLAKKLKAGRA